MYVNQIWKTNQIKNEQNLQYENYNKKIQYHNLVIYMDLIYMLMDDNNFSIDYVLLRNSIYYNV